MNRRAFLRSVGGLLAAGALGLELALRAPEVRPRRLVVDELSLRAALEQALARAPHQMGLAKLGPIQWRTARADAARREHVIRRTEGRA